MTGRGGGVLLLTASIDLSASATSFKVQWASGAVDTADPGWTPGWILDDTAGSTTSVNEAVTSAVVCCSSPLFPPALQSEIIIHTANEAFEATASVNQ